VERADRENAKAMTRLFIAIAAILGGSSVAAGAFVSYALRDQLSERTVGLA